MRTVFDFRSEKERTLAPDPDFPGVVNIPASAMLAEDGSEVDFDLEKLLRSEDGIRMLTEGVHESYARMPFGNPAYRALFGAIRAGQTPILFHCTAGKDRTGVAAMLILLALGASDETICADFVQSNTCRKEEIEALWAEHAEEIAARPEQKYFYLGISGVHPDDGPFVLQTIREQYGTTDAYLEAEYGLTPARLMRLRRMYLE